MEQTFEKCSIIKQELIEDISPMKVSTTNMIDLYNTNIIKNIRETQDKKTTPPTNIFFSFLFVYIYLYIYIFLFFFSFLGVYRDIYKFYIGVYIYVGI